MHVAFAPPPSDLGPWISGFAERRDAQAFGKVRELPVAHPMLQFMTGGDYHLAGAGPAPRAALWGPVLTPTAAWTDIPATVFIAILTGRGAVALSGMELSRLAGRRVPLTAIDAVADESLTRPLLEAGDFRARQHIACDWFRRRLALVAAPVSPTLALSDRILLGELRAPVHEIARTAGVTPRGLSKAFEREVGCSPKRLLRLARLQRVLRSLHPRPWNGKSGHDAVLEYHDLAHLDRDFRDLTGISRSDYVRAKESAGDPLVYTVV